jgi:betaine-aldehyde dehydrogenase
MNASTALQTPHSPPAALRLPQQRGLFYGGAWHAPHSDRYDEVVNPATGASLGRVAVAGAEDADSAVAAARAGLQHWRHVPPLERARTLREVAQVIRAHAAELALLDAADCGNPVRELLADVEVGAMFLDYFAGLVTEMKGASVPMGPDYVNFSVREPVGVIARIVPFNHPILFNVAKLAAPLAAGNTVVLKPAEQAPLSALRMAELIGPLLPPGVLGVLTGGREVGAALSAHTGVDMVTLTGSVPTGRAVMHAAAERIKPVLLELGGKNAMIVFPDADPREVARNAVDGMNFTWCSQSCGSLSRLFLHDSVHDAVVTHLREEVQRFRPGIPTDPATTMGTLINRTQFDRVMSYIEAGRAEGAQLLCGGRRPDDPALAQGHFLEPTIFTGVTQDMRIAREEIFGPVLSVLRWSDRATMMQQVNSVDYGLTASIWTDDLNEAHRTANEVQAGYVWVNRVSQHLLGAPFGGYKQSGIGREDCLSELLSFTVEKNIHINMARRPRMG